MEKKSNGQTAINDLSLVQYLHELGIEPIATRTGELDYRSPFSHDSPAIMTVYQDSNSFEDIGSGLKGSLCEFVCHLFGCSPEELCSDIARYRLYAVGRHTAALD
jgi:hypothetical protein